MSGGRTRSGDLERFEAYDAALEALSNVHRRRALKSLLEESVQRAIPPPADGEEMESTRIALHHVHLPKLDDTGFIEWDRDANEISRGPRFDEIAILIEALAFHSNDLLDRWS